MIIKTLFAVLVFIPMISSGLYRICTEGGKYFTGDSLPVEIHPSSLHYHTIYLNAYNLKHWYNSKPDDNQGFLIDIYYVEQKKDYKAAVEFYYYNGVKHRVQLKICEAEGCKLMKDVKFDLKDYSSNDVLFIWLKYHPGDREMKVFVNFYGYDKQHATTFEDVYFGKISGINVKTLGEYATFSYFCLEESTIFKYKPSSCTAESSTGEKVKTGIEVAALVVGFLALAVALPESVVVGLDAIYVTEEGFTAAEGSTALEASAGDGGEVAVEEEEVSSATSTSSGQRLLVSRQILARIGKHWKTMIETICFVGNELGIGFDVEFNKEYYNETTGTTEKLTCLTISAGRGGRAFKNPPAGGQYTYCFGKHGTLHVVGVAAPTASYATGFSKEFAKLKPCVQFVIKNVGDYVTNHVLPEFGTKHCNIDETEEAQSVTNDINEHWQKKVE